MLNVGCKVTEKHNRGTTMYYTVEDNKSVIKCILICDEFAK